LSTDRVALLFDIDGTLIDTGGAGAASWRIAFDELYGIPADIGEFTDAGMTDPEVGRRTFVAVIGHPPSRSEFSRLLERRLHHLYETVADSKAYRVLAGVETMLPRLINGGYLLGLVTGLLDTGWGATVIDPHGESPQGAPPPPVGGRTAAHVRGPQPPEHEPAAHQPRRARRAARNRHRAHGYRRPVAICLTLTAAGFPNLVGHALARTTQFHSNCSRAA